MISHNKLSLNSAESSVIKNVIKSGWVAQGNQVSKFENEICKFLKLPKGHAVAVSSCSMAMFVSLKVLNAKNKSVGIPVYVSRVLRGAISLAGAKEKLFDININNPNIDMKNVYKQPPNFLIIPHMFGIPVDLSNYKKSIIIENCAHSLGAYVRGTPTGLQGHVGVLSFQATKLITTGGMGGMIISRDSKIIKKAKIYRDFDNSKNHVPNVNVKMTDLQAAIGRVQLKKLRSFLKKRSALFKLYKEAGLNLMSSDLEKEINPTRYRAVVMTKYPKKLIRKLKKNKIKAIIPIETWELLSKKKKFKNAINMTKKTVSIPLYPSLSLKNAKKIANIVKKSH